METDIMEAYFRNRKAAELSNSCTSLGLGLEVGVADSFFSLACTVYAQRALSLQNLAATSYSYLFWPFYLQPFGELLGYPL